MTSNGDAAEQVVRLSLEGFEVAAKLSGSAAKEVAILLVSVLKQEVTQSNKTRGKARLSNMIKSGKELKVFSIQQKDLPTFTKHAKDYGILYCVLRDKNSNNPEAGVDIIARAEDASKIQRIVDRFEIGRVDKASIVAEAEKDLAKQKEPEQDIRTKSKGARIVEEAMGDSTQKEKASKENPSAARTDNTHTNKSSVKSADKKPSVREKLNGYKAAAAKQKEERIEPEAEKLKTKQKQSQTVHQQPKNKKKKTKER